MSFSLECRTLKSGNSYNLKTSPGMSAHEKQPTLALASETYNLKTSPGMSAHEKQPTLASETYPAQPIDEAERNSLLAFSPRQNDWKENQS